jgi:hypothetical protein
VLNTLVVVLFQEEECALCKCEKAEKVRAGAIVGNALGSWG